MQLSSLHDVLIEQLAGLDCAEMQVLSKLPRLAPTASGAELRKSLDKHLCETHGHVREVDRIHRLDAALADLGVARPADEGGEPLHGPIDDGGGAAGVAGVSAAPAAELSEAAQRVEHYEIAAYATARALACELGYATTISLLDETIAEPGDPDSLLSRLAAGDFASRG